MGGYNWGERETYVKDTWTKPKGGRIKDGKWGWLGAGSGGGEMETTVLKQQYKQTNKKKRIPGKGAGRNFQKKIAITLHGRENYSM